MEGGRIALPTCRLTSPNTCQTSKFHGSGLSTGNPRYTSSTQFSWVSLSWFQVPWVLRWFYIQHIERVDVNVEKLSGDETWFSSSERHVWERWYNLNTKMREIEWFCFQLIFMIWLTTQRKINVTSIYLRINSKRLNTYWLRNYECSLTRSRASWCAMRPRQDARYDWWI